MSTNKISKPRQLLNCPAPAKLNLFLHVVGRRPDGYHLLQSAFQLIDRCDSLDFYVREDAQIRRMNAIEGIPEAEDLVIRAARLLQQHTQTQLGADIVLHKVLPMGGGLGGGSSDAATTLIALNYLWDTQLSQSELMELGLQLGADVPFFIFGENAFVEGIGEQMQALPSSGLWYVVIEPGVHTPTPRIFSAKELTRNTKIVTISDFSSAVANNWRNDLQSVACNLFPEIQLAINWLNEFGSGANKAQMTGSGACVFCAFSNEEDAIKIQKQVPKHWTSWSASAVNQHPMLNYL
jgi:4-diphosphocytidyl-2-C-methyl-D-erythritol kinase